MDADRTRREIELEAEVAALRARLAGAAPAAEQLLDAWLSTTADGVAVLDEAGRVVRASRNPGVATAVIEGQPWIELWAGEDRQRAEAALAAARRGEVAHFRGSLAAGTAAGYWEVQLAPVGGCPEARGVLVTARDVSQERRSEQRLLEIARKVSQNARAEIENLRRLLHHAPSIMCVLSGPEHRFELLNEAALQLTGHRDLLGLTAREAFPGPEGDELLAVLDPVFATGQPFVAAEAAVKLQRQPGGRREDAFLNMVFQAIRDEQGKVSGVFVEGTDITARVRAERALAESERRLRLAQEVAGIGSLEVDIATGETRGSEQFWRIWGLTPRDSVNISVLEKIVVAEDSTRRSNADTRRSGTAVPQVEYRIRRPDTGELRWVARHIEFIHDSDGTPRQMIGVMQDITERRQAEEQRALLSRELEHRMKNILAMVGAIAAQTLRGNDMERARESFLARLTALGAASDVLLVRNWQSAPIRAVVEGALAPHRTGDDRVRISGPDLRLGARQALALALALHELATNAAKYGSLSTPGGHVSVAWSTDETTAGEPVFRLHWRERGGPPVVVPAHRGFGSRLIERVLAADFHGRVGIDYDAEGVSCLLEAPLGELPGREGDTGS